MQVMSGINGLRGALKIGRSLRGVKIFMGYSTDSNNIIQKPYRQAGMPILF